MSFDFESVRDILACPVCHSELVMADAQLICTSAEHRASYPIVDEIPRLLDEESSELSVEVWGQAMEKAGRDPATGEPFPQPPSLL